MTRIASTYNANSPRHSQRAFAGPRSAQRLQAGAVIEADVVSDQPIEEVVFEAGTGVNQRGRQRGYGVREVREDVLVEKRQMAEGNRDLAKGPFWQRYSTPFMAQMIGQVAAPAHQVTRAYGQLETAPRQQHLSKAV